MESLHTPQGLTSWDTVKSCVISENIHTPRENTFVSDPPPPGNFHSIRVCVIDFPTVKNVFIKKLQRMKCHFLAPSFLLFLMVIEMHGIPSAVFCVLC